MTLGAELVGFLKTTSVPSPAAKAESNDTIAISAIDKLTATLLVMLSATWMARAVDFHVATAQDLQNALTQAANNGADDIIYLTNGYYIGNFNYNSAEARNLTLQAEPGVTNTQITIDGA